MPPIIEKIRKLLAIAERSDSEHERDTAMQQVYRLAQKHALDLTDVRRQIEDGGLREEFVHFGESIPPEVKAACVIVREFFFVRPLLSANSCGKLRLQLFGHEHHVAVARYVFHFLRRTFADKWKRRVRRQGHRRGHGSYVGGLCCAVIDLLVSERRGDASGLMHVGPALDAALAKRYPGLESVNESIMADPDGYRDGQDIRIRKPLRDHSQRQPLLTGEG